GTLKYEFVPQGGIVAEQTKGKGTAGQGRLADLGPALSEFSPRPVFGEGYGTRMTGGPKTNAQILDDQWLKTLLETGFVGIFAWVWLFRRFVGRTWREAKADRTDRGRLLVALTASIYG